jgi:DHA2 family multidrug resistance protein
MSQVLDPARMATGQKVAAFSAMCLGMFIALLDIQIVSASLREIGGGCRPAPTKPSGSRPAT